MMSVIKQEGGRGLSMRLNVLALHTSEGLVVLINSIIHPL